MEYPHFYMGLYGLYMDYAPLTTWDAHPSTQWLPNIHMCHCQNLNCSVLVALSFTATENQR